MNTDTNMIDAVFRAADQAAVQSDRWLFVALLMVTFVAVFVLGRWLAGQYAKMLDTWRADMQAMQTEIKGLHTERIAAAERYGAELRETLRRQNEDAKAVLREFASIAARNAEVLGSVTKALGELQTNCSQTRLAFSRGESR
ncbi:MAG: hypothetical protein LDL56_04360 [Armatimonadetes bacterium]|nr:hypothetical protein [Armatimonadota bacterium]